jgi:hypothetical protein
MRLGTLAAVSVAVLLAIGVALAASIGSGPSDGPVITKASYMRNVDHGEPERLGDCPLWQWITVEPDGELQSVWYLQRRQNGLCSPIIDYEDGSPASEPDAPDVAARSSIRLLPKQMGFLRDRIAQLQWQQKWGPIEDMEFPPGLSLGCDLHFPRSDMGAGDYDPRLLVVEGPHDMAAALTFFSTREARRAGQNCEAVQTWNIAMIDAAFAPHVGLMPEKMTLPLNLSKLLEPRNMYLTD